MDKQFLIDCQDLIWHLENQLHLITLCDELMGQKATPTPENLARVQLILDAYQSSVRHQLADFRKAIFTQTTGE